MAMEFNGFFDSREGDIREYTEADMARFTKTIARSGVRDVDALQISSANDGLRVHASYGSAMVSGRYYALEDDGGAIKQIALSAPASRPRIDRIILRMDANTDQKLVTMMILQGVEADSPVAPTLTRTDVVYEISLARVYLTPGISVVTPEAITDEREEDALCGIIQGREDGAYDLAARAQETADAGVRNAAAAQETADAGVKDAETAQETADAAIEGIKGAHYWAIGPVSVSVTVAGWTYDKDNDRYYKSHTVAGLTTAMVPFASAANVGFKFPLCGCEVKENGKLLLYMTNTPTITGTVKVYGMAVKS